MAGTSLKEFAQLTIVKEFVVNIFNDELRKQTNEEASNKLKAFFLGFYFEYKIHTLFVPKVLQELTESIFTDVIVRDLVLNLTGQVAILLSVEEFDKEELYVTIANGICLNKEPSDSSLINEKLRLSMKVDKEYVLDILKNNFWLVCLVILYLFMQKTDLFDQNPA